MNTGLTVVQIKGGATENTIGGTTAAQRNVISGLNNGNTGIRIIGSGTSGNFVYGNSIGVNLAGTAKIGDVGTGVYIYNGASGNFIGTNGDGNSDASEGNVISGTHDVGVQLEKHNDNAIAGNLIGIVSPSVPTTSQAATDGTFEQHNSSYASASTASSGLTLAATSKLVNSIISQPVSFTFGVVVCLSIHR